MKITARKLLVIGGIVVLVLLLFGAWQALKHTLEFGGSIGSAHHLSSLTIRTAYGDTFFVETTKIDDFPDPQILEAIYPGPVKTKNPLLTIGALHWGVADSDDFMPVYTSAHLNCYVCQADVSPVVIWRKKASNVYGYLYYSDFANADPTKYQFLRPMAHAMVMSGRWQRFLTFAKFLVRTHDAAITPMIRRYAAGTFTPEELRINADSYVTKTQVIHCARELLAWTNTHP